MSSLEKPERLAPLSLREQAREAHRTSLITGVLEERLLCSAGTAVQVVSIRPATRKRRIPTIHGSVIWLDGETGVPMAVIDGGGLTALRTGAASGAAPRALAEQSASVLAVVGSGVRAVRPIAAIRIASRTRASARQLAKTVAADASVAVDVCGTRADAGAGADLVSCATMSQTPLFPLSALKERAHVNAVGAFRSDMCEVGSDVLAAASVVAVDQREAAEHEAGDVIMALREGVPARDSLVELGEVLAGGRAERLRRITVFKSVGLAAQDWAVAGSTVARAMGRREESRA